MSVAKLLDDVASVRNVPVSLDYVIKQIRNRDIQDHIHFFQDVDLDPKILRGFLMQEEVGVGSKKQIVSTVTYAKMGHEMERLVCCKELLHILDPEHHKISAPADVRALIREIILPAELIDPLPDTDAFWSDRLAQLEALAILCPLAVRNHLYDSYMRGLISLGKISDVLELPQQYVARAMNGNWPRVLGILIGLRRRSEYTRDNVPAPIRNESLKGRL